MWSFIKKTGLYLLGLAFISIIFLAIMSSKYNIYSKTEQDRLSAGHTKSAAAEYILVDGTDGSETAAKRIAEFVASLPTGHTDEMVSGWKVIIGEDVASKQTSSTVAGVTLWKSRVILLNTYPDLEITYKTFIHEMGHFFDMSNGFHSLSEEFKKLYLKYKPTYKEDDPSMSKEYITSTEQEFFASAFKEFYLCPEHLKVIAPEIYDYMQNAIRSAGEKEWYMDFKDDLIALYRTQKANIEATQSLNVFKTEAENVI